MKKVFYLGLTNLNNDRDLKNSGLTINIAYGL